MNNPKVSLQIIVDADEPEELVIYIKKITMSTNSVLNSSTNANEFINTLIKNN